MHVGAAGERSAQTIERRRSVVDAAYVAYTDLGGACAGGAEKVGYSFVHDPVFALTSGIRWVVIEVVGAPLRKEPCVTAFVGADCEVVVADPIRATTKRLPVFAGLLDLREA